MNTNNIIHCVRYLDVIHNNIKFAKIVYKSTIFKSLLTTVTFITFCLFFLKLSTICR